MKKPSLWCFSLNGEDYSHGTYSSTKAALEAAQKAAADDGGSVQLLYIAKAETQSNHSFFPDGSDIIEHMADQADSVGGDWANDYPDVSSEAEQELTKELHELLEKWCKKHDVSPSFYLVSDPVVYHAATLKATKKTA